jgi:hypothetical protein
MSGPLTLVTQPMADRYNAAIRASGDAIRVALGAGTQARADATVVLEAVRQAVARNWTDSGTAQYAASAAAVAAQSVANFRTALATMDAAFAAEQQARPSGYPVHTPTAAGLAYYTRLVPVRAWLTTYIAPSLPATLDAAQAVYAGYAAAPPLTDAQRAAMQVAGGATLNDAGVYVRPAASTDPAAQQIAAGLSPDHKFESAGSSPTFDGAITPIVSTATAAEPPTPAPVNAALPFALDSSTLLIVVLLVIVLALLAKG